MIQLTKSRMMSQRVKHGIHARKNSRWVLLILIQQSIQISRIGHKHISESPAQTITAQADSKSINVIQRQGTEYILIFSGIAVTKMADKYGTVLGNIK